MRLPAEFQIPIAAAVGVLLLVLAAEKLHERRCRSVARLAAGPAGAHLVHEPAVEHPEVVIEGAAHGPHIEKPEVFLPALAAHLMTA